MATDAQRKKIVEIWNILHDYQHLIRYEQKRPMDVVFKYQSLDALLFDLRNNVDVWMDCSETVTLICKLAGLKDPNGLHYDGYGYTGTLLSNLPHYKDPAEARPGALAVLGPGTGDHVVQVIKAGKNPLVGSFGSDKTVKLVPLSVEQAIHRKPTTMLSIAKL